MSFTPNDSQARPGADAGVVFSAYLFGFLPLGLIYALDYITRDYKAISTTRYHGYLTILLSIPSMCYLSYYTFLQDRASDYKEMAGAIAVLFLHVCFLLRTFWGLAQLAKFTKFSIDITERWCRLGYSIPVYRHAPDVGFDTVTRILVNRLSFVTGRYHEGRSLSSDEHIRSPKLTFALTCSAIKCLFERAWRGKQQQHWQERVYDQKTISVTVDKYMHVNNLLLDNSFTGAELRFRLIMDKSQGFLECSTPEDAVVRWIISFLSRCGRQWIRHTRELTSEIRNEANYFAQDLFIVTLMHVTRPRMIKKEGSTPRTDLVTKLGPLHVLSSVLGSARDSQVEIATENSIPVKNGKTIDFMQHQYVLADAARKTSSLLGESMLGDREAVRKLTPQQLSCFVKLVQNDGLKMGPQVLPDITQWEDTYKTVRWNAADPRIEMLQYQLGWGPEEDFSVLFEGVPLPKEYFDMFLWGPESGLFLLQCSVHVDNWIALMQGARMVNYLLKSDGSLPRCGPVFEYWKDLELRVQQYEISDTARKTRKWKHLNDVRFIGCVMDEVRSMLADWVEKECGRGKIANWLPPLTEGGIEFVCSEQLMQALRINKMEDDKNKEDKVMSVHMTLLWELQWRIHSTLTQQIALGEVKDLPSSNLLMILAVLAFPSVQILCQGPSESQALRGRPVGALEHSAHVYAIDAVGLPVKRRVLFRCDDKKNVTVRLDVSNEELFNWEDIRDAFKGGLSGQKEWRTTRKYSKKELLLEDTPKSIRSDIFKRGDSRVFYKLVCWPGWLPHMPEIARFELSKFVGNEKYFRFSDSRYEDLKEDIRTVRKALEEMVDTAAPEEIFEEAKMSCKPSRFEKASRLYQRCISHHLHNGALIEATKLVCNNPVNKGMLDGFLESVDDAFRSLSKKHNAASSFKKFGLEELSDCLEAVYEETSNEWALVLLSKARFHQVTFDMAFPDLVFELFEAHIEMNKTYGFFSSWLYLALGHFRNSRVCGNDQELQLARRNLNCFIAVLEKKDGIKVCRADDLYRFCASWNDWKWLQEIFEKDNIWQSIDETHF